MATLKSIIAPFVAALATKEIEIYNEFSLQHELGFFLRHTFPNLKIQFERNVNSYFGDKSGFTKKEIDISAFSARNKDLAFAIELKCPRNGQYPEQMFSFCKDIAFAEELVNAGFPRSAFIVFAEDPLFYKGSGDDIYGLFRGGIPIHGTISKPTGGKDVQVSIRGSYQIEWNTIVDKLKYAIVEVVSDT